DPVARSKSSLSSTHWSRAWQPLLSPRGPGTDRPYKDFVHSAATWSRRWMGRPCTSEVVMFRFSFVAASALALVVAGCADSGSSPTMPSASPSLSDRSGGDAAANADKDDDDHDD